MPVLRYGHDQDIAKHLCLLKMTYMPDMHQVKDTVAVNDGFPLCL
jgi:hypothetical protein